MHSDEIRARSSEKIKQVISLMKALNITVGARERVDKEGFIEKVVYYTDHEIYPTAPEAPEVVSNSDLTAEKASEAAPNTQVPGPTTPPGPAQEEVA
jgi:hypothetical protein